MEEARSSVIQFVCSTCKTHVTVFGLSAEPERKLCAVCFWLEEADIDPKIQDEIRKAVYGDDA